MLRSIQTLALAALLASLIGCGGNPTPSSEGSGAAKADTPKIAIITNGASPFWDPMEVGARRAEAETGSEVVVQHPNPAGSGEQIRLIESMISQGVDGIAISPYDADAIGDTMKRAMDAGIPVICFDSDAPQTGRLAYIGTINYNAGVAAGEAAKKVFPNGAKLVVQVGNLTAQNARDRLQGFKDATEGANIEILEEMTDDLQSRKAQSNAETAIQKYENLDGFLTLYSYNAPAAARALESAGKVGELKIIGFDAEPQTLEYLEQGVIDVCIGQKPYQFGYKSVQLLNDIIKQGKEKALAGLPENNIIDTGVDVITRESLPEYKEELKKLGIKSS